MATMDMQCALVADSIALASVRLATASFEWPYSLDRKGRTRKRVRLGSTVSSAPASISAIVQPLFCKFLRWRS
jgi:hypothetical protein